MVRIRLNYQGRVQRVGFRARARDTAKLYEVTGWVRNEPDGTVLLEVQGTPHHVEMYLRDLGRRVSGLVEREVRAETRVFRHESGFEIVYHNQTVS